MKNQKLNLILVLPIIIFTLMVLDCGKEEFSANKILPAEDSVSDNRALISHSIQSYVNKQVNSSKDLSFLKEWIGKYPINKNSKKFANFFEIPQVKNLLTEILGKDGYLNLIKHLAASTLIKEKKGFLEILGTSARKENMDVDYGMIAINLKTGGTHVFLVDNEKLSGFNNVSGNGNLPLAVKADILPYTGQAEIIGTITQRPGDGYGCYAVLPKDWDAEWDKRPYIFFI